MIHAKSINSRPVVVVATPTTSEAQQFRTAYQMRLIFLRRHVALRNKLMFTAFSADVLLNSYLTITNGPRASDRTHVPLENDLQMHQDRTQLVSHCVVIHLLSLVTEGGEHESLKMRRARLEYSCTTTEFMYQTE